MKVECINLNGNFTITEPPFDSSASDEKKYKVLLMQCAYTSRRMSEVYLSRTIPGPVHNSGFMTDAELLLNNIANAFSLVDNYIVSSIVRFRRHDIGIIHMLCSESTILKYAMMRPTCKEQEFVLYCYDISCNMYAAAANIGENYQDSRMDRIAGYVFESVVRVFDILRNLFSVVANDKDGLGESRNTSNVIEIYKRFAESVTRKLNAVEEST